MGDDISQRVQTYAASLKEGTPVRRVPKYISIEDFGRIINIIRQDNNATAEIIVRLMFEYGLRLGEVLGITNEDVTEKKWTEIFVLLSIYEIEPQIIKNIRVQRRY